MVRRNAECDGLLDGPASAAVALAARKYGEALAKRREEEIEFEERLPYAMIVLDLNRWIWSLPFGGP